MSLRDIGIILREYNKEPEPVTSKSSHARSLEMFSNGKSTIEVSIELDLQFETIQKYYYEYLALKNMHDFVTVLNNYRNFLPFFIHIAEKMLKRELFIDHVNLMIEYLYDLKKLSDEKYKLLSEVDVLKIEKSNLVHGY